MSLCVVVSTRAEADLTHQYRWYLENASVEVAERFLTSFDATVETLAAHPGLGRATRFRSLELAGIRSFPIRRRFSVHIIFYRTSGDTLRVERVMHGARDLPKRLAEP